MSEESNTTVNTLGDRVRFYEDVFRKKEAETNDEEQRALQIRLNTLQEIKARVSVQIYAGDNFKLLDTLGLKDLILYLDAEIFKIERDGTLDKQLLVEDAVANLSWADINNVRFHSDRVETGEIDYSKDPIEKRTWPVGRMKSKAASQNTSPVGDDGKLPGPKELTTMKMRTQERTNEGDDGWPKFRGE